MMNTEFYLLAGLLGLILLALIFILLQQHRSRTEAHETTEAMARQQEAFTRLEQEFEQAYATHRRENAEQALALREELARATLQAVHSANTMQTQSLTELGKLQAQQLTRFSEQLQTLQQHLQQQAQSLRESLGAGQAQLIENQHGRFEHFTLHLQKLAQSLQDLGERLRDTLDIRLQALQKDNGERLEKMRETVDEKLQGTLEKRLGESFKLVSERLEAVHQGLGDMQKLAKGVGDLKNVLTNVKARGIWGEMQLATLLEQMMTPDQYATNVAVRPGSNERVEFAIRLPGLSDEGLRVNGQMQDCVWLPLDAKFPREDYERLLDAVEKSDAAAVELAGKALELRIRGQARDIHDKYIAPPHTTDFAIMFLPTEGLYAEVLRRAGLADSLQRDFRVVLAGPTTLAAIINALQMGFKTLAIEKRSSEVWRTLGEVKSGFGKFGDLLDKVKKKIDEAGNSIDNAARASRTLERRLRNVEALPFADTAVSALIEPSLGDVKL